MEPRANNDPLPDEVPVLIVGAGPSGLMLAAELALSGTRPLLIDALERPTGQSRALGFTVRTLEIFMQRGILDRFGELAQQPGVHYAGLVIDGKHLSSPLRPANTYPQSRTETVLAGWASELGARIARPWRFVTADRTDDGRYRCLLDSEGVERIVTARFVVGCDGARSRVREWMGVTSDSSDPSVQMLLGDLTGSDLPDRPFGVKHRGGMVMSAPLGDGTDRVIVCDFSRPFAPHGTPVTCPDIKAAYENVVGRPLRGDCVWASSFTDASSLVSAYRRDGVLLVGDSAHTHLPAGGQGMNVSIQDAVNLGWKLAAVVQGRAPESLLDTYHTERHPVAQQLLRNTAAQGQLFLRGPEVDPVREMLSGLLAVPGVATVLGDSVSGLDVCYPMPDTTPDDLIGSRLGPGVLSVEASDRDAVEELRHGRAVLYSLRRDAAVDDEARRWAPHLHCVRARVRMPEHDLDLAGAHEVLVRPDGHIAWIGTQQQRELRKNLVSWLGTPGGT